MAIYCANCGNQIREGAKFCQSCGAPAAQVSEATTRSTFSPPASPYQPPPGSYPAPSYEAPSAGAPPKRSSTALKVVLITFGIFIVLFVTAVIGIGIFIKRAAENISVKEGPGGQAEVNIKTPGGDLNISAKGEVSEEQLGVPIYPGAKADESSGSFSISGASKEGRGSFSAVTLTTTDSLDEVVAFYKEALANEITNTVESSSGGNRTVVLTVKMENASKNISIIDEGKGVTKIAIISVAKLARP